MRRLAVLWLLALLPLAGCAGAEGERARELLERAVAAQDELSSATFTAELSFAVPGETVELTLDGGGYFKGDRRGDLFLRLGASGLESVPANVEVVVKGGRVHVSRGSDWLSLLLPAFDGGSAEQVDPAVASRAMRALAESVEDLAVTEGQLFGGEPATVITGRIDVKKLFREVEPQLGAAGFPGRVPFFSEDLAEQIGDLNVSLMISERTGLLVGALASIRVGGAAGFKAQLVYRLTSADEPVKLPRIPK